MVEVPHFAVPFRIGIVGHGTPTALVTEQDSPRGNPRLYRSSA